MNHYYFEGRFPQYKISARQKLLKKIEQVLFTIQILVLTLKTGILLRLLLTEKMSCIT